MPQIGWQELVIVLTLALLVFGPRRLPELGRSLGGAFREFRSGVQGLKAGVAQPEEGGVPAALPLQARDWEGVAAGGETAPPVATESGRAAVREQAEGAGPLPAAAAEE